MVKQEKYKIASCTGFFFSSKKTVTIKSYNKILHFKIFQRIENYHLLKKSLKISWLLTKNLKESYYHILEGGIIKNNMAYDFMVETSFMSKLKIVLFKKKSYKYNGFSLAKNVFLWGCG